VKLAALVAVPPGVVTRIGPDLAPFGTVALICVLATTVKLIERPFNVTDVAPVKFEPEIVTAVPGGPVGGVNSRRRWDRRRGRTCLPWPRPRRR
jgi:hypothetical protein